MSFTLNNNSQWAAGGDISVTSTSEHDPSHLPVITAARGTNGVHLTSSATFFDPIYLYTSTLGDTFTFDSYHQYHIGGSFPEHNSRLLHDFDQEAENKHTQGPNEEVSTKKKGKKRPPRHYTAEQLAKRREQNRKAQRTYRDRKDQRIKELEDQLAAASQQTEIISSAIDALRAEHAALTGSSVAEGYSSPYGAYPAVTGV